MKKAYFKYLGLIYLTLISVGYNIRILSHLQAKTQSDETIYGLDSTEYTLTYYIPHVDLIDEPTNLIDKVALLSVKDF